MKHLLLALFSLLAVAGKAQQGKMKGLLLLSTQRTANSFDLFFPLSIDSTKSLKWNIESASEKPAFMINAKDVLDEATLAKGQLVRNQALGKSVQDSMDWILVIPVEASFESSKAVFARNEKDSFLDWPVQCFGKKLFEFYNARQRPLVSVRVIELKE